MVPATGPTPPPTDRRPLYLDPREQARVTLDGPALRIQVPAVADRQVPLRRLSRILATARTEFSTAALLACAERGITVVLTDSDGQVLARILGQPGERQELRQRMLDLMSRADWREQYRGWLYSADRFARLEIQRRLKMPAQLHLRGDLLAWINREAERQAPRACAHNSQRWLRQLADAWMLNHLSQLGLGGETEWLLDGWPDLPADLSRILYWHLEPQRLGWLRRRRHWAERQGRLPPPVTRRDLTGLFERSGARIGRAGRGISNRLHQWLVGIL
jgi:hypothetical protein